jgi:hypothetical protein
MVPKISDFGLATRLDKPDTRDGMVGKQLGIILSNWTITVLQR